MDADEIIRLLELEPHPEGGAFRETYRSRERAATARGERSVSTAIYFLIRKGTFSALHRSASDEVWHHHLGDPLRIVVIGEDGTRSDHVLGLELGSGQRPQAIVPAGAWFGARLEQEEIGYALVSCTVAPGFDFADFELGEQEALLDRFPQHERVIRELTR
jgi:predicted cupin superfamily sugar epimerase